MNEKGLIDQVLRLINKNYSNIYVIDIQMDKVYSFGFSESNSLEIKETFTYTNFVDLAPKFVHSADISAYFDAISLNKLEESSQKGNNETKIKYRKLSETGEYRWYVNIIDYLPFDGRKLIFMMSEDVNERLMDSEEKTLKLESTVNDYKNRLTRETESIGDAIYQINNMLEQGVDSKSLQMRDTRSYINSIFNQVSADNPELNNVITNKMVSTANYKKPTILIVDDSSIIRNSLKRIFAPLYEIIMAKDGSEAINEISSRIISGNNEDNIVAVLLDLLMPGTDGFAVLDFFKTHDLFAKIPVAIISGDETKETRRKVYEYDIVDMLEKPFNTENIRRRMSKMINLHMSSNNLQHIVYQQNLELKETENMKYLENIKVIMNQIVNNVCSSNEAIKLKKIVRILGINLANNYPKYNLDAKYIDSIISGAPLYNIGGIAMKDDLVITSDAIKQEINYGLDILKSCDIGTSNKKVLENIIKYSCEAFNGQGYPNSIKGNDIPIEAQITNLAVKLNKSNAKTFTSVIKSIQEKESDKYNPDLIDVLNKSKKELNDLV